MSDTEPSDLPTAAAVRVPLTAPQAAADTSAMVWTASDPAAAAVILAHGAGADMHHPLMQRHAADLAAAGNAVALFNFAYTEVGRRRPDPPSRLESAWRDAIHALRPLLGTDRPLVIGGRSMGGRIASTLAAADADELGIDGVCCTAYPLHPPGRPDRLRVDHWPQLRVPTLLVCGSRDPMAPVERLHAGVARHMPAGIATVHVVEGADHSFGVRRSDGRTSAEVLDEVASTIQGWLSTAVRARGRGGG